MTPSRGTDRRSFRISDDLWQRATNAAASAGVTLSDVVREALERFVEEQEQEKP